METTQQIIKSMTFYRHSQVKTIHAGTKVVVAERIVNGKKQYLQHGFERHCMGNPFTNYLISE